MAQTSLTDLMDRGLLREAIDNMFTELYTLTTVSVTGATTLTGTAFGKMHSLSGTSADYTVGLPTAVGNTGKAIAFKGVTALTKIVTIDGNASEPIDSLLIREISSGGGFTLVSTGAGWDVINEMPSTVPYVPVPGGFSANPAFPSTYYSLLGKRLTLFINSGTGTSNATSFTIPLPGNMVCNRYALAMIKFSNNGGTFATTSGFVEVSSTSSTMTLYTSFVNALWTASSLKQAQFNITLEIQ